MRNFDYLINIGITELYRFCSVAEENQQSNPDFSAVNARKALEYLTKTIYNLKGIAISERTSLYELVDGEPFKEFISDERIMMAVHYVRKVGNNGAHSGNVSKKESFFCLLNLYNVVGAILLKLKVVDEVKPFDRTLVPKKAESFPLTPVTTDTIVTDKLVSIADKEAVNSKSPVSAINCEISEAETRKMYIDLMLREAGWQVLATEGAIQPSKACIEVELQGMPNAHNVGYADYVLFGGDGKPLAVIEAKRTSVSPINGKHQAELYAECLEKRYGVMPVIYYTNGFETYIIDGLGYPPRRLYSFHTEKDLNFLIQKRGRHDITDLTINDSITNRHYQKTAIKAICEHFNKMHRKGLLVMATGTGKTRVSISLVDVLQRNGWVKNTLFLADRTSLVTQAHRNFVKLLPSATTCILSDNTEKKEVKDYNARITFSTYQTMINFIDTDEKPFSLGRFDLIIIDEAHRSIFGKYGAIFSYFDSLLIGLTATPRDEIERSTYEIFEMEQGIPNYAYEHDEAVRDGFLVDYHVFSRGSLIMQEGIKYDKLSDDEKKQLEAVWEYEEARRALDLPIGRKMRRIPVIEENNSQLVAENPPEYGHRDIDSSEIFSYIFNKDTIDAVLQDLMENGLKVQSGERIGKTIIFAYNHRHAELITQRFNELYPEYGSKFCVLIDNYVTYAQSIIDDFEKRDCDPQIAVSVDMLDTGIDIPDILNLVFFKVVRSKIKFTQMIGRGTRLSPDIFGPGKDKECFYIFDWCKNFEFFGQGYKDPPVSLSQSLTEKIFRLRADIAFYLQHQQYQEDSYCKGLHDEIKSIMKAQVALLSDNHISVRAKWEAVSHFKDENAWTYISELDTLSLKSDIAPLLKKDTKDENAKKFDAIALTIELGFVNSKVNPTRCIQRVQVIADKLKKKATIPQIQAKMGTIDEVLSKIAWENMNLQWLEKVRNDLRDLMQFLVGDKDKWFVVDIDDVITLGGEIEGITPKQSYKQRIIDYLANNRHLPVIDKIYNLEQLTSADIDELERILWTELGSKDEYNNCTLGLPCGGNVAIFIRSIIGIDRKLAMKRFSDFISGAELNSEQEEFLTTIVSYVCANGDITTDVVVNESPFEERLDIFNDYMDQLAKYINNIHKVVNPVA